MSVLSLHYDKMDSGHTEGISAQSHLCGTTERKWRKSFKIKKLGTKYSNMKNNELLKLIFINN